MGIDYRIRWRVGLYPVLVMAPHGGRIEPGTSEIADMIAGSSFWFYAFEGIMENENFLKLHVPSTCFNEEFWCRIAKQVDYTVSVHGLSEQEAVVVVGGKDVEGATLLESMLRSKGFKILEKRRNDIKGSHPKNVVNRNRSGMGIQLELGRKLRFASNGRMFAQIVANFLYDRMRMFVGEAKR